MRQPQRSKTAVTVLGKAERKCTTGK